jgi:hypothetical protein
MNRPVTLLIQLLAKYAGSLVVGYRISILACQGGAALSPPPLFCGSLRFTHHGPHDGHKGENDAATNAAACHLTYDRAKIETAGSFCGFRWNNSTGECRYNLTAKAATDDAGNGIDDSALVNALE